MKQRTEIIGSCALYLGDCHEILQGIGKVDAVVTDPPYPDYLQDEYKYFDGILKPLENYQCRQFVFWSIKSNFPLSYTARHVWDKKTGCGSEYEFIYERNGYRNFKVFRNYLINSSVAASYCSEVYTGHKSQKPVKLIKQIILYGIKNNIILDPFMGSGSTGVACIELGRNFVGVEINEDYFNAACKRIEQAYNEHRNQPELLPDTAERAAAVGE